MLQVLEVGALLGGPSSGFIVDAREFPRHIQQEAVEKGIIPHLPE